MASLGRTTRREVLVLSLAVLALACGGGDDAADGGPVTFAPTTNSTTDDSADASGSTGGPGSSPDSTGSTDSVDPTTGPGSTTTEPGSGDDTTGPPVDPCPEGHDCFFLEGVFHVPDEATPTAIYDIPLPGEEYTAVEVELTVTHGGWFPEDPAGLHNIFWLHRGTFDNFTWMGGVLGYVNARGPGTNIIRTRHDLDVMDLADSQTYNINGVALADGTTYTVFYRYDTAAAEVLVEVREGGRVIASGTDVPTTDRIRNTEGGFFIYFANDTDVSIPGPEVPSLGWSFADLRVEFIP